MLTPQLPSQENLSTIPDPRAPLTPPEISRSNSVSPHHPELSNEVAALSNKLIHAINHQTDLDDTLNDTRHQLEAAQERVQELERREQEHKSMVDNRILVRWADVEEDTLRMRVNLADERKRRVQAENEKKNIEQELESLTQALFEEANQMVAASKREAQTDRETTERRNDQLQAQLKESEGLLASHQEQLAELKQAMSGLSTSRYEADALTATSTAPSTPAPEGHEQVHRLFDGLMISPTTPSNHDIAPAPPTQFSHLISPMLRNDVPAFEDFQTLMEIGRRSGPPSRVPSGNYSGFAGLGLTGLGKPEQPQLTGRFPSNASTSSLPTPHPPHSASSTPNLPNSTHSSMSAREAPLGAVPLKETTFYKRALAEDIEPTLRLETAPGLSWLARRSVISSICEGRLVIEPMPASVRNFHQPCSLCGEQSRHQSKSRTHRFRINESETAQRYPLCEYCLNRIRSTCDFLSFLRLIKDGHWRTEGSEAENAAWEESVRLRERMFWARIGGGVVPTSLRPKQETPRSSTEDQKPLPSTADIQQDPVDRAAETDKPLPPQPETAIDPDLPNSDIDLRPASSLPGSFEPSEIRLDRSPARSVSSISSRFGSPAKDYTDLPAGKPSRPTMEEGRSPTPSLQRSTTRSRGSSRTEPSGQANSSVAKRAAMFERQTSQEAASNQLQQSLQATVKSRTTSGR